METPLDPTQVLREQERAAALPYTEYPRTPTWYYPAVGAWATALLGVLVHLDDSPWRFLGLLALVALEVVFLWWSRRQRGTWPSLRHAPPAFRPVLVRYCVGVVAIVAVLLVAGLWAPAWVGLALCFTLVTGGLWVHERQFAEAADRTREQLG